MSLIELGLLNRGQRLKLVVKPFRDRYDPSAAVGVPAHITLLYPFKPPNEVSSAVLDKLRARFARFAAIQFSLSSVRRGPGLGTFGTRPRSPMSHSAD